MGQYEVVVNGEDQYSVWRTHLPLPTGWSGTGVRGSRAECLDWISTQWTDVRPKSVRTMVSTPDRVAGLDAGDVARALAAGTGPAAFDDGNTVPVLIERVAREYPDRRAVELDADSLTYAELDSRAGAVAGRLRAAGVRPDDVVGVHADRSLELIVALVGILKAGAAYLPLDPSNPGRRLAGLVSDAAPVLVLSENPAAANGFAPAHRCLDVTEVTLPDDITSIVDSPHPDQLAYVIFTSGSTGRPKGVQNTHRALHNRLRWMQHAYPLTEADAVLQKTPLSFDVSVWELFWPLTVGARLVIARPGWHKDPDYLGSVIRERAVTVVHFVPSMLRAFLRAGAMAGCSSLRHVVCSGEALPPALRAAFFAESDALLHNLYGPTEAAIDVTAYDCDPDADPDTVPIGTPISGLSVHVLGARCEPLAAGVVGEIYIGGIGLARGYAGQPGLTAERFVADPYGLPGSRLYRTGDLARRRADGAVEFLGRADNQVALRGFRIELGEVENAIERVPGVRQAVVTMWSHVDGAAGLAAYCTVDSPDALAAAREAVAATLPSYMVPNRWLAVPELPLLPSGKVDRGRLPEPAAPTPASAERLAEPERPWTEVESLLAIAWGRALGSRPKHLNDDFFLSGGDSILSIELVVAARALGLAMTVQKIFENPTLAGLAAVLERAPHDAAPQPRPFTLLVAEDRAALPDGIEDAVPLSALLSGLYFESRTSPNYRVYTTSMRLAGTFDEQRMRLALADVVRRHPFLRTSVWVSPAGNPVQLVHPSVPDPLTVVDLREAGDPGAVLDPWLAGQRDTRYDWSRAPLLAITVHRLTDEEFQLTLTEPFLDGWSVTLVLSELLARYRDGGPEQEPIWVQPGFLAGERDALACADSKAFWRELLTDPPVGTLPFGDPVPGYRVREVAVTASTGSRLRQLADELGVPVKSVLLAAHVQVIALLTGRTEVITGLMSHGRPESADGVRAVGMFLNAIPLRATVSGTRRALVSAVHAAEADTLPHRFYPAAQIRRESQLDRLFETVFNFTHFRLYRDLVDDERLRLVEMRATDQTYYPLAAQFRQDVLTGELALTLELCDTGLSDERLDRIAGYYRAALEELAGRPDQPVAPLDRLLPTASPATATMFTADADLFGVFAEQALRTPDADALRYLDNRVSYAELRASALALAARLTDRGVGDGSVVAVCMRRSPAYVAAVLAVLASGAAYLPVDPGHPPERTARILAASGCRLVMITRGYELSGVEVLPVDLGDLAGEPSRAGTPIIDPAAPAVVVGTSGSAGGPKCVALSHAAVLNRLRWSHDAEPAEPGEIFALRTPIGFVDSVAELFDGLTRGVPTRIVPDEIRDPDGLVTVLSDAGVSRVTMVPTLLAEILRLPRDLGADLRGVRLWHLSGEPLRGELIRTLRALVPGTVVRNLYGSTEVCADATVYTVAGECPGLVPVGTPLPAVSVEVRHEDGGLVPDGTLGELTIGGAALAIGYLGDARLTADRFTPAPDGGRLYRTGDVAVRGEDGVLELLGRIDRQLKVRGVRVEPAEVEAALCTHPAVAEAVVTQRIRAGRPVLVGYLRTELPAGSLGAELRPYLLERLPGAAVPDVFVAVTEWARLSSGKINVRALPDIGATPTVPGRPAAEPVTPVETELAGLWAQRLGSPPSTVDDNFFDLGGQSLDTIVLAKAITRRFDVEVSVADLFRHPTLAMQAQLVSRQR